MMIIKKEVCNEIWMLPNPGGLLKIQPAARRAWALSTMDILLVYLWSGTTIYVFLYYYQNINQNKIFCEPSDMSSWCALSRKQFIK